MEKSTNLEKEMTGKKNSAVHSLANGAEAPLCENLTEAQKNLFHPDHMIRYDTMKTLMAQKPFSIFLLLKQYIEHGQKDTSCEVTNVFINAAAEYLEDFREAIEEHREELISICPKIYAIWMTVIELFNEKKKMSTKKKDLESDYSEFTLKTFPSSSPVRDMIEANPIGMLKHMTKLLKSQDAKDNFHSDKLFIGQKFQLLTEAERLNWSILRDWNQMEKRLQSRILYNIVSSYYIFRVHLETHRREFYESERSMQIQTNNLTRLIELEWLMEKGAKTVLEICNVFEEWLRPKLGELKSKDRVIMSVYKELMTIRSACLPFMKNTPWNELSKEQENAMLSFNRLTYGLCKAFASGKTIMEIFAEDLEDKPFPVNFMRSPLDLTESNVKLDIIEEIMVEYPMGVLERLEECITEKSESGSGDVKNAILRTEKKCYLNYVDTVKGLDPNSATYRDKLLHISRSVYSSLKTVIDLPFNDCDVLKPGFDLPYQCLNLYDLWDSDVLVYFVSKYPIKVFKRMEELLICEDVSRYLTNEDYEEYSTTRKNHLMDITHLKQHKPEKWNMLSQKVKRQLLDKIADVYHTFDEFHARGRTTYLKTDHSKDPFKVDNLPDDFQLQWLIKGNVLKMFYTFEDLVRSAHEDPNNEEYANHPNFKYGINKVRLDCLKLLQEQGWNDMYKPQRKTIVHFIQTAYDIFYQRTVDKNKSAKEPEAKQEEVNPHRTVPSKKVQSSEKKVTDDLDKLSIDNNARKDFKLKEQSKGSPKSCKSDKCANTVYLQEPKIDNDLSKDIEPKKKSEDSKPSVSNNLEDFKKVVCFNEACANMKKLYLQERNNRTLAEGELKQNKAKMDEWKKLKKEEEKWKVEKKELEKRNKNMEKEINTLSTQAEENKKLREKVEELEMENLRLTSSNEKIKTSHGKLEGEYNFLLEEKREQYQKLEEADQSNLMLRKEKQALLEENQQLNGPISRKTDSVEEKRRWHEKLRDNFKPEEVLNSIKNMTAVFEQRTPQFQALMEIEQRRLETASDLYSRILDYNLQLLEDTNSNTGLLPVPHVPEISSRFVTKFNEEMKKQFPDPEDEVGLNMEKTCYICFEPFTGKEKIYECKRFSKHIVCSKCGDKIITEGRGVCGHCEGPLKISKYEISRYQ